MNFVERVLYNEDALKCREPFKVNEEALDRYLRQIEICNELKAKGYFDFGADHYDKPYYLHCISIKWNFDDSGMVTFETSEIDELLAKADELLIDNDNLGWQLSTTIYTEVEGN